MTQDWQRFQHESRCGGKAAYRNGAIADRKAEKASHKTNELIISYQCPDCGWWHIGHAEHLQVLVRHAPPVMNCVECTKPIPAERLDEARRNRVTVTTCSQQCARRRNRRLRREAAAKAQSDPTPPVSQGGIPGPA